MPNYLTSDVQFCIYNTDEFMRRPKLWNKSSHKFPHGGRGTYPLPQPWGCYGDSAQKWDYFLRKVTYVLLILYINTYLWLKMKLMLAYYELKKLHKFWMKLVSRYFSKRLLRWSKWPLIICYLMNVSTTCRYK